MNANSSQPTQSRCAASAWRRLGHFGPQVFAVALLAAGLLCGSPLNAQRLQTLAIFDQTNGRVPTGCPLLVANDGSIYGTTYDAYNSDLGTVFRWTPGGGLTTVVRFTGANGQEPMQLIQAPDGTIYGTTWRGGKDDDGTIFRISPQSSFATLVHINDLTEFKPGSPGRGIVRGPDGNIYVTMAYEYLSPGGALYRMTPGGDMQRLVRFDEFQPPYGTDPYAVVAAADGMLYGVTGGGGNRGGLATNYGHGTVYRVSLGGVFTSLFRFSGGANGSHPGILLQAKDGNFYGLTSLGGNYDKGTLFRLTPGGTLQTLAHFGADGESGSAALLQARDGNFYGYTSKRIFRMTPSGSVSTAMRLGGDSGGLSSLVEGADGNLYGTTWPYYSSIQGRYFPATFFKVDWTTPADTVAPTLRVDGAASSGRVVTGAGRILLRGLASDNVSPAALQFRVKAPRGSYGRWRSMALPGGGKTKPWSLSVALPRRGEWQIQLRAADYAGRLSAVRTISAGRR